jgi:hypothetical protein
MCTIVDIVYLALVDIQWNLFVPLLPTNLKSSGTLLCNVVLHQFWVVDIFQKDQTRYLYINKSIRTQTAYGSLMCMQWYTILNDWNR